MRRALLATGCVLLLLCVAAGPRTSIDLNPGWKFMRQDVAGAEQPGFDDSSWQSVNLPHTWNNLDGEDGGNNYYRGIGWYRRHLKLGDQAVAGKSLFIQFDGGSLKTSVFVNGKSAGPTHTDMFGAFCYDITPLLDIHGDNVIAVQADNSKDADIPPLSADFTFFGGLYRGVRLLALDPVSITPLDDGSPGVYIRQTNVSSASADVSITTKLRNSNPSATTATVTCEILDASGQVVQSVHGDVSVPPGGTADSVLPMTVTQPHLWNGRKDPYLYHMRVTVNDGARITDQEVQPLGFRYFSVDPDKGFFLNGASYSLHGVNRHQDRQDMGWAIGSAEQRQDFDLIMEMGCTAIRLSHYQHAQEFYDLCDQGGLVVWAESCMVNNVTNSPAFDDAARRQLRELIKQNFNHPSICFWSLFNELGTEKKSTRAAAAAQVKHQVELVTSLNAIAHELDPDRLTTAATNHYGHNDPINAITDILGVNRYDGWYSGKPENWGKDLDTLHAGMPTRSVAISEYGAGASVIQHVFPTTQPKTTGRFHPEEWQCTVHEQAYAAMEQRPWLWGTFIWCMFDFGSDGRSEGDHLGINDKGMVTYDRKIKKDVFYFYKANWSDDPFVYITDRRFTPRPVDNAPIKVYSNCDSVELFLGGHSLGSKTAANHIFIWDDVKLSAGDNDISATGLRNGKQFSDACGIAYDAGR